MSTNRETRFERAQRHQEYRAWLEAMDSELSRFLTEDAPVVGGLSDPFSSEGLSATEDNVRQRFGSIQAVEDPGRAAEVDRYGRFIGEVFRRSTEAQWVNVAHVHDTTVWPELVFPFARESFNPREQIGAAFVKNPRPPSEMVWVLNNMIADYEFWRECGRPTPEVFDELVVERIVAEFDGNDV